MVAAEMLVGLMAVPGMPLWLLWVLLTVATLASGPFKATQVALLPDVLAGERFAVGLAIRNITSQAAQLAGFAGGGALIALLNPSVGLAVNAATFLISAVVVRAGVGRRALPPRDPSSPWQSSVAAGTALVWRDPGLRTLLGLCWLAGFYIAPEALAAPYAAAIGGGTVAVGLIMAADSRGQRARRLRVQPVDSRTCPGQGHRHAGDHCGDSAGGVRGPARAARVHGLDRDIRRVRHRLQHPRHRAVRARAARGATVTSGVGTAVVRLITVQGLGALMAGVLADEIGPAHTVALAGIAGVLVAIPIAIEWGRARRTLTCRGWS
jgi:hypothetical protein